VTCPECAAEVVGTSNYCPVCGHKLKSDAPERQRGNATDAAPKLPAGFSRTLSTDLVTKQIELRTAANLATLVENRTYQAGEVIILQGEASRDLIFLTSGIVEISRKAAEEELVLNEIEPPYILGDVAFLFGMPRTATARAKTEVKAFILRYDELKEMLKDLPAWVHPLLTALASDIKSLHHKTQTLEKRALEAEAKGQNRS
jgi:CRP-like cAMP-binding protein